MYKLIAELRRLYLMQDQQEDELRLQQHLLGLQTLITDLSDSAGQVRALVLDFHKLPDDAHWRQLCDVASALQTELGLPAPAVSVSGGESYRLWLSLDTPVPLEEARRFKALLHQSYFADQEIDLAKTAVELPPCVHRATGLWAAFIHPGMGASFADDLGLDMQPPLAAQVGFLEGLRSIGAAEFRQAIATLEQKHATPAPAAATAEPGRRGKTPDSLLLKDATLNDIVQFLHEQNIEPSFRFLLKGSC